MSGTSALVGVLVALALAAPARAQRAAPSVELTDAAGDVETANGPGNSRDVVRLSLRSDGTSIVVGATLAADERGTMAGAVVDLYLDTDNRAATGGTSDGHSGFEYVGGLNVCMAYEGDRIAACAGGPSVEPRGRYSRIVLDKFTGAAPEKIQRFVNSDMVMTGMGPGDKPLQGRVLEGKIPYATLGVRAGQTVRIVAREADAALGQGYFAEVRLMLQ